jgi:hypothetical protein
LRSLGATLRTRARGTGSWPAALPWLTLAPAVAVLKWAFSNAAGSTSSAHFAIFWLGIALFAGPVIIRILGPAASARERYALLVALGVFLFIPKYLRDPSMPLFHDELAHWRATETLLATGTAFHPNYIIYVIGEFPGLHALAAALVLLTGLSLWHTATALLAVLHVLALLGIVDLTRTVSGGRTRLAAIAGLIYALNPSYMYFDAQFAYESLSIVLVIWVLAATARFTDPAASATTVRAWFGAGLILAGACIMTHHLATYALVGFLIGATALAAFPRGMAPVRRQRWQLLLAFTTLVLLGALLWAVFAAPDIFAYLAPNLTGGIDQLANLLTHSAHAGTTQAVFSKSPLPLYERAFGALSVPIIAAGSVLGLRVLWRRRPLSNLAVLTPALVVLGLVFFASLPFVFSAAGAESAHRSWGYSFIGLAVLIAPAVDHLLDPATHTVGRGLVAIRTLVAVGFACTLVGMVADGIGASYRFPGPFAWGSATLSLDHEMLTLTRRFRHRFGQQQRVIADYYSSLALAAFGNEHTAEPSRGFPTWELYFDTAFPHHLLREMVGSGWNFVVVDERMSSVTPLQNFYIAPGERAHGAPVVRPSKLALEKFDRVPWAKLVLATQHYHVYRLNLSLLSSTLARSSS